MPKMQWREVKTSRIALVMTLVFCLFELSCDEAIKGILQFFELGDRMNILTLVRLQIMGGN